MSTDRETTRVVRSWLEAGVTRLPDRVLDAVLDQVPATPQRRPLWRAWRSLTLNSPVRYAIVAAAVLVVALIGYQFLPSNSGPVGGDPTTPPTPPPTAPSTGLLARGTFTLYGAEIALEATGSGDDVTGTMSVTHEDGNFTVDLQCSVTTEDGVLLLAGDITESASPHAREGRREVLVLKPGSPIYASFDSEGREGGDVRPASSCPALLQQVIQTGTQTAINPNGLVPIEGGSIAFGP